MWHVEKGTEDLVFNGVETGIAASPHKGVANLQNINLNTETGEAMISFGRQLQSTIPVTGLTFTQFTSNSVTIVTSYVLVVGQSFAIGSGITGLSAGNYYIASVTGATGTSQVVQFSKKYGASVVSGLSGSGTATAATFNVGLPLASAIEKYFDGTIQQYRYYILDTSGYVWVLDTGTTWASTLWTCINIQNQVQNASGLAVLNGYLHIFQPSSIYSKETVLLGIDWLAISAFTMNTSSVGFFNPHYCFTGHIIPLAYTDGQFIGTITPSSITTANLINNFSYGSFTETSSLLTITTLIAGNFPLVGQTITFGSTGTVDSAVSVNTVYYVIASGYSAPNNQFKVSATVGGSSVAWNGDGTGTQYFNSYDPNVAATVTQTPQAYTLPPFEITKSMCEIGGTILIGCQGNVIYPWNGLDANPTSQAGFINIPENNVTRMLAVNNMAYVFAGNKGNIYLCNGVIASPVLSVPDYCAGIPGSPSSYIEPYFVWGGADYIRGRVYFSILDQTAAKAGNCGGIWSFVPTQNYFPQQDTGIALRMENTSSYGTLNGFAPVIIGNQNQAAIGVQYFSAWTSTYLGTTNGIDGSGTFPTATGIVETDMFLTGTLQDKKSFAQVEYKTASPLLSGESIALNYRLNATDAWASCGTVKTETNQFLSGYCTADFQSTQEIQFQALLIPNGTSTYSGNRLLELRLR